MAESHPGCPYCGSDGDRHALGCPHNRNPKQKSSPVGDVSEEEEPVSDESRLQIADRWPTLHNWTHGGTALAPELIRECHDVIAYYGGTEHGWINTPRTPMPDPVPQEQGVDPVEARERWIFAVAQALAPFIGLNSTRRDAARTIETALRDAGLSSPSLSREEWENVIDRPSANAPQHRWDAHHRGVAKLRRWLATGETEHDLPDR